MTREKARFVILGLLVYIGGVGFEEDLKNI
jgi:hypothetical protein